MKQCPNCSLLLAQTTFIVDLVLRKTFSVVVVADAIVQSVNIRLCIRIQQNKAVLSRVISRTNQCTLKPNKDKFT